MDAQQKHSPSACTWRLPAACGHARRCSKVAPLGTPSTTKYSAARPHAAKHLPSAGTRACIYGIRCFQHCLDPTGLAFSPEAHIPISLRPHTQSQPSCTLVGTSQPTSKVSLLTIAALKLPPPQRNCCEHFLYRLLPLTLSPVLADKSLPHRDMHLIHAHCKTHTIFTQTPRCTASS